MSILLITPPFTQPNTPYPATAYLKGFLQTNGYTVFHSDLSLEVTLKIFSSLGLKEIFSAVDKSKLTNDTKKTCLLKNSYINTIDAVIHFLQGKNDTLSHTICNGNFLPHSKRFEQTDDLDWAFGNLGIQDKAKHLATLYLEDIIELISQTVDPHFGFSKYAERLSRTLTHFDPIHNALQKKATFTDKILINELEDKINTHQPNIIGITIPFPGNLYSALRCGKHIKQHHPNIKIIVGGGYVNTELRSLSDSRVFDYLDYMTLDDGELPFLKIIESIERSESSDLKRTFILDKNKEISYSNNSTERDIPLVASGTPDFTGLFLDKYISVLEVINPMHRLWSDGRWNKLTLAHGCYWGKCTFCDTSLDYIKRYEPLSASILCDRIESMIEQTGQTGFHFVDEAAPPALLRELSLELINRNINITWWTNIRFEHSFTADLCKLMSKSGCIAVTGGLEVASDRLLKLMKKGVSVAQVASVAHFFTENNIMVHAYLMYGFPTQTTQETIDALEYVRQMFYNGVIQSGFWHQFAMTAHSPIGLNPDEYKVQHIGPKEGGFANNDYYHEDPEGCEHELFSDGLKASLYNYMHGICFDYQLSQWFDFDIPNTTIPSDFIYNEIQLSVTNNKTKQLSKVYWTSEEVNISYFDKKKKGNIIKMAKLTFSNKVDVIELTCESGFGQWIVKTLSTTEIRKGILWQHLVDDFTNQFDNTTKLTQHHVWHSLLRNGLFII